MLSDEDDKQLDGLIAAAFRLQGETFPVTDGEVERFCRSIEPAKSDPALLKRLMDRVVAQRDQDDKAARLESLVRLIAVPTLPALLDPGQLIELAADWRRLRRVTEQLTALLLAHRHDIDAALRGGGESDAKGNI